MDQNQHQHSHSHPPPPQRQAQEQHEFWRSHNPPLLHPPPPLPPDMTFHYNQSLLSQQHYYPPLVGLSSESQYTSTSSQHGLDVHLRTVPPPQLYTSSPVGMSNIPLPTNSNQSLPQNPRMRIQSQSQPRASSASSSTTSTRGKNGNVKSKRKRLSLQDTTTITSSNEKNGGSKVKAVGSGSTRTSPNLIQDQMHSEGEGEQEVDTDLQVDDEEDNHDKSSPSKGKRKSSSGSVVNSGLTSCEACRKGKRRCEPSPLVPPDHPDAAKLPCARCRRFATECVRVRTVKKKGPAKVDLSALSDAAHGFHISGDPSAGAPSGSFDVKPRKSSSMSSNYYGSPILASAVPMVDTLDQIISQTMLDAVLQLFFDYAYPLTPCLHRPTFMADLAARRDLSDPIFFALVLSVVASTLVQVPRNLIDMDKGEVERLVRQCLRVAKEKMAFMWEEPTAPQSTMSEMGVGYLILGNNTAHVVITAQANQLALALRLNEESSYEGLDPIEEQIRRRVYWLLFQADKSTACMVSASTLTELTSQRSRTINLRLEDASELRLPAEVDDEQITPTGILPQPQGQTPLIAGFNVVTNLFKTLNDALIVQRKQLPETVEGIMMDLQVMDLLRDRTIRTCAEVAEPLQLGRLHDSRAESPAVDWQAKLHARFVDYFETTGSQQPLNSFAVMQGNILVTQHVVRMVIHQVRKTLQERLAIYTNIPPQLDQGEQPEDLACELLDALNSLPIECVAINGPSLVQKGIQLMESSPDPSQTSRAQRLLMQFLSVLSVIEGMYSFGRDISAE